MSYQSRKRARSNSDYSIIDTPMDNYHYMLMAEPKYPRRFYGYTAQLRDENSYRRYGKTWNMAGPEQRMNRVRDNYVGAGKYKRVKSPMYRRVKGRGMYLGNFAGQGNYFKRMMRRQMNRTLSGKTPLGALGKKIGRRALGAVEGVVTGQGEYDLNGGAPASNNLVAGGGLSVPTFSTNNDETGSLVIQHSEYVKDIYGVPWSSNDPSEAVIQEPFKNDAISLNPGLPNSFPWLSQIAANYEEYEMIQLMFCFKTRVGDNLTTTDGQVGTLLMFTDYNASDNPRRTKQDLLQGYGTSVSKISDTDILHGIECDPSKIKGDAHKFVRTGGINTDLQDFDWGLFQIAVDNTPAVLSNKVIGELYVSYTVRLSKPRLYATLGHAIQQDQFLIRTTKPSGTLVATNTLEALGSSNSIGCAIDTTATSSATGNALIDVTLPGSFSGAFEVLCVGDEDTLQSDSGFYSIELDDFDGNISLKTDMVAGDLTGALEGSSATATDGDPSAGVNLELSSAVSRIVSIYHMETTMAAFGADNKFRIRVKVPNASSLNISNKVSISIRRYNSLDRKGADSFVTPAGGNYIIGSN